MSNNDNGSNVLDSITSRLNDSIAESNRQIGRLEERLERAEGVTHELLLQRIDELTQQVLELKSQLRVAQGPVGIPASALREMLSIFQDPKGQKIAMIKLVRDYTGQDLRGSKEFVEHYERFRTAEQGGNYDPNP